MRDAPIPFNRPYLTGGEDAYIAQALGSGHLSGDGAFTKRATAELTSLMGAPSADCCLAGSSPSNATPITTNITMS